jgi:hypothetical protein
MSFQLRRQEGRILFAKEHAQFTSLRVIHDWWGTVQVKLFAQIRLIACPSIHHFVAGYNTIPIRVVGCLGGFKIFLLHITYVTYVP